MMIHAFISDNIDSINPHYSIRIILNFGHHFPRGCYHNLLNLLILLNVSFSTAALPLLPAGCPNPGPTQRCCGRHLLTKFATDLSWCLGIHQQTPSYFGSTGTLETSSFTSYFHRRHFILFLKFSNVYVLSKIGQQSFELKWIIISWNKIYIITILFIHFMFVILIAF